MTTRSTHTCSDERKLMSPSRAGVRFAALATAALLALTLAGCAQDTSTEPAESTMSTEEETEQAPDSDTDTDRIAFYPDWMSDELVAHVEKTCPNYQPPFRTAEIIPDGFPELPVNTDDWTVTQAELSRVQWLTLGEVETIYNEIVEAYTAAGWTIVADVERKEPLDWTTEFTNPAEELNHKYHILIFSCDGIVTISMAT